jgi:hypothetical protein
LDREEGRSLPCLSIWQYSVYTMEQQYTAERFVPSKKSSRTIYRISYVSFHVQYVKKLSIKRIYNHIANEKKKRIFRTYGTLLRV